MLQSARGRIILEVAGNYRVLLPTDLKSLILKDLKPFSDGVQLDPDGLLTPSQISEFKKLHLQHDSVFDPHFTGYNDYSGKIRAHLNIGPVSPPAQKARLPLYDNGNLELLQKESDNLEELGTYLVLN